MKEKKKPVKKKTAAPKPKLTEEQKAENKKIREAANLVIANRREKVIALHLSGASVRAIADHLSAAGETVSKSTVQTDINAMLDEKNADIEKSIVRLRNLQIRRLSALILPHWGKAQAGDVQKTYLVRTLLKDLSELGGANMPTKIDHDHNINFNELSDEELQLIASSKG